MAFCSICGASLEAGARFCGECGQPVRDVPRGTPEEKIQMVSPDAGTPVKKGRQRKRIVIFAIVILIALGAIFIIGSNLDYWVQQNKFGLGKLSWLYPSMKAREETRATKEKGSLPSRLIPPRPGQETRVPDRAPDGYVGEQYSPEFRALLRQTQRIYISPKGQTIVLWEQQFPILLAGVIGHALRQQLVFVQQNPSLNSKFMDLQRETKSYLAGVAQRTQVPGTTLNDLWYFTARAIQGYEDEQVWQNYGVQIGTMPSIFTPGFGQ